MGDASCIAALREPNDTFFLVQTAPYQWLRLWAELEKGNFLGAELPFRMCLFDCVPKLIEQFPARRVLSLSDLDQAADGFFRRSSVLRGGTRDRKLFDEH